MPNADAAAAIPARDVTTYVTSSTVTMPSQRSSSAIVAMSSRRLGRDAQVEQARAVGRVAHHRPVVADDRRTDAEQVGGALRQHVPPRRREHDVDAGGDGFVHGGGVGLADGVVLAHQRAVEVERDQPDAPASTVRPCRSVAAVRRRHVEGNPSLSACMLT